VRANFTDGNNVLATAVETFQAVQPIPYTLSVVTALANATGGLKANSTAANGIAVEMANSSAQAGTSVTVTSFIFLNAPPDRNFTAQLGAVPEEYAEVALSNTSIEGIVLLYLTSQAVNASSSVYYYSNSRQTWMQASNVTFVASDNPFGPGTIHAYMPVSELAGTTIAVVNGPVIPEFSSGIVFAAFTLIASAFSFVFRRKRNT